MRVGKRYRFLEHVTDALLEAYGKNLGEAYESAACGLMDTILSLRTVRGVSPDTFQISGADLNNLLYNWLEEILIRVSTRRMAYSSFRVEIIRSGTGYALSAEAVWEPFDPRKHRPKVEVKSPTYHLMTVRENRDNVVLRFLLDL